MELYPISGKRSWRSFYLTHERTPCNCPTLDHAHTPRGIHKGEKHVMQAPVPLSLADPSMSSAKRKLKADAFVEKLASDVSKYIAADAHIQDESTFRTHLRSSFSQMGSVSLRSILLENIDDYSSLLWEKYWEQTSPAPNKTAKRKRTSQTRLNLFSPAAFEQAASTASDIGTLQSQCITHLRCTALPENVGLHSKPTSYVLRPSRPF